MQTTLCYLEKDDKYLMLHRTVKKNDMNDDKWLGVGGKFEKDESPDDCLMREVKEETGLTLTSYKYRGIITFITGKYPTEYMHLFTADKWTGEMINCNEGTLTWVKKEDVLNLPIWQGDLIFFDLLNKNAPFFSLKLVYEGDNLAQAVLDGQPISL